jgi:23S rRNA (cytidine1920-2'-O)/16S rRNA (cytidine1409-2'-O)-methyltransferase
MAESREKAKAIIMTGNVFVNEQREDKAGSTFPEDVRIEVRGTPMKYVSRGGYKLEKAIELWEVPLIDKICMDVGSSTGGFTDCMLQNGAQKVYAIDVGTNQLAWKLRQDDRVVSMEKTNIRYVTHKEVPDDIAFSSIDVAFISLTKVLMPVRELLGAGGRVVCLVKPQFEAGREKVGKKGVVRDKKVHLEVVCEIMQYALSIGFQILALSFSPIKGPEGNIEYLLYLEKGAEETICEDVQGFFEENYLSLAKETVEKAHGALD